MKTTTRANGNITITLPDEASAPIDIPDLPQRKRRSAKAHEAPIDQEINALLSALTEDETRGEGTEDFQVLDLSEYQAVVSPDLHLIYGEDGTDLSGRVTVAKARIAPVGFQGSVSSSRDVIVVDTDGKQEKNGLPLSLDLELIMGKEVEVDAFGVKGLLDGSLKINQKPGQVMTGLGSLNLRDGTFVFKGANLKINRGLVFYQGGPIDDPGLDVQADKEVNDKEVGIQLTGSVSHMEMNLF